MNLSRIDRQYVDVNVTATLRDGTPATLTGVDVALLTVHGKPTSATTWTPSTYADGIATVLLAGPDAAGSGALVVPAGGADLWIRVVDTPEVDAVQVARITVS